MRMLFQTSAFNECFDRLFRNFAKFSMAVAWASTSFPGYDALLRERTKISRAIVGIHFYQTHPDFITTFLADARFRFSLNPIEVFHPKLYLFDTSPNNWACLVGSGNFTPGGFGINDEAFVLVGNADDPQGMVYDTLLNAMEDYWQKGKQLNQSELQGYRRRWEQNQYRLKSVMGDYGDKGRLPHEIPALNMSWLEFTQRVQNDAYHSLGQRLEIIREARNLFEVHNTFNPISGSW